VAATWFPFFADGLPPRASERTSAPRVHRTGATGFRNKERVMRRTLLTLSALAAVALATPASAQSARYAAPVAGAVVGTGVALGLHNGWWSNSVAGTALPTTLAGAATTGFVVGVGTVALIDAATTPCRGFHAFFGGFLTSGAGCVNGEWVGDAAPRAVRRR
jgi:hypothetical protein